MKLLIIDTYLCNGCGTCIEMCPEVFFFDETSGKAALVVPEPIITDEVYQAAAYCPEKCIEILK